VQLSIEAPGGDARRPGRRSLRRVARGVYSHRRLPRHAAQWGPL